MSPLTDGISIAFEHWRRMEADVRDKSPEEACGIVIGIGDHSELVIPVTNILHSPVKFRMDPQEELDAFYLAEQKEMEILAIYHSHPHGIGEPSPTDIEELTFPGTVYLIWYNKKHEWHCRGFYMAMNNAISEVPLRLISR